MHPVLQIFRFTVVGLLGLFLSGAAGGTRAILWAGGGPENVLVIVNADDPTSQLIANHYIHWRKIPPTNVLYLQDVPRKILINFPEYKAKILQPILKYLDDAKLSGQIDYLVFSAGFPPSVAVPEHYKKLTNQLEREQGKKAEEMFKLFFAQASLTSLTYFASPVLADQPIYMGLDANHYYRRPAELFLELPFVGREKSVFNAARKHLADKEYAEASKMLEALAEKHPAQLAVVYAAAQARGGAEDAGGAAEWLIKAQRLGWCYRDYTRRDPHFAKVLSDPLVSGVLDRLPAQPFDFAPTMGFSSRFSWGVNGGINGSSDQGVNYLLCTMLAMTWDNGNSESEALKYLERAVQADGTHPQGTFYFCETADVRTKTRQPGFANAIEHLQALGATAEIVKGPLPTAGPVAGVMLGAATFQWPGEQVQMVPGAIADNLTSYGGKFDGKSQTHLTELLRYGAAGSSGTVIEPYALQQKFPHPMIQVHYRRGSSLAEAFYQSLSGPFQLLLVGDALCRPWANFSPIRVRNHEPSAVVSGPVTLELEFAAPDQIGVLEFYLDGHLTSRRLKADSIQFDSTKLTDGYHEFRIVGISNDPLQTKTNCILPLIVQNQNHQVRLQTDHSEYALTDTIRCSVRGTVGTKLLLFHNSRLLSQKSGQVAEFDVPASLVGRGPVQLSAVAIDEAGKEYLSPPVAIQVKGTIRDTVDSVGK